MSPLKPWMRRLLRFAGTYNIIAGLAMIFCYHEGYKLLGLQKPDVVMPIQLVGILVALFGAGYHRVASAPIENRNILVLGFWSKTLGSLPCIYHVVLGNLPLTFLPVVFFADIIYLPFFAVILRHLGSGRVRSGPAVPAESLNKPRLAETA